MIPVDRGPDDAECRRRLRQVFGTRHDEYQVIASLRRAQNRYSGLSYDSPYMKERIFFSPVLEPEPDDEQIEFLYAIHPTTASGLGGYLLLDGTVVLGWEQSEARVFPSLDHFIECDALLDAAREFPLLDKLRGADVRPYLDDLHAQRPSLRTLPEASGYASQWWADGEVLLHWDQTWAELWNTADQTVRMWLTPSNWIEESGGQDIQGSSPTPTS